ncbi:YciI family protein [Janthinobacterium sp. GW460P]|uniref:YciI family protein n=1 Tax=unclassified Janthinobacterium TaxID=2610881 RepID=UPI000A32A887|nr:MULTISPECIES: YciI family protein [unclassified Janthinobacterium]MCC7704214.1 YciI family protein [Janthinobacterium sp. GW460P]MCC7709734.1 YciI family protein [Janthinobacterium sp. GW460W]
MEYMILIYADEARYEVMQEGQMASLMAEFASYTQALEAAGVLRGGAELAPVRSATSVRVRNGKPVITDGPFAETKEQLGGYYLLACADLDEALAWAGRCPAAALGTIEVRPVTS